MVEALGLLHLLDVDPLSHHGVLPQGQFQTLRVPLLGQVDVPVSRVLPAASLVVLLRRVHPFLIDILAAFLLENLIAF